MAEQKRSGKHPDKTKQAQKPKPDTEDANIQIIPKPESSSEYEGARDRKPSGNPPVEIKTETSSSSGE
jgi:hypothetical protein